MFSTRYYFLKVAIDTLTDFWQILQNYWDYMYVMRVPRENGSKSDVEVKGDCYKCLKIAALTIS